MISHDILYYIYILIFGAYCSVKIACGKICVRERRALLMLCPALLLLQGLGLQLLNEEALWKLYPLIAHLPIILTLIFCLKCRWDLSLVAVVVSYSLCQLPRWIGLVLSALGMSEPAAIIVHLSLSQILLVLLSRFCLPSIHAMLKCMQHLLTGFGALPIIYYLYDYFMVYTARRYAAVMAFSELLPTGLVLFFVLFALAYQRENLRRRNAEEDRGIMEMKLSHAEREISMLRTIEEQTAIHRHDLHHHLTMIDSMLGAEKYVQASEYIRQVSDHVAAVATERFCENETVNLLLGAFSRRAQECEIPFSVRAPLPENLPFPDSELCALISNALENAIHAAGEAETPFVEVYCGVRKNKLLLEVKNACRGNVPMENGMPASAKDRHGCRSIQTIVLRHKGVSRFEEENSVFTLRIAIPF